MLPGADHGDRDPAMIAWGLLTWIAFGALAGVGLAVASYWEDWRARHRALEHLARERARDREDHEVTWLDALWELPSREPRRTA
jgi:hypothetical protein